eukprot:5788732-Amphidinium_carterae.1
MSGIPNAGSFIPSSWEATHAELSASVSDPLLRACGCRKHPVVVVAVVAAVLGGLEGRGVP